MYLKQATFPFVIFALTFLASISSLTAGQELVEHAARGQALSEIVNAQLLSERSSSLLARGEDEEDDTIDEDDNDDNENDNDDDGEIEDDAGHVSIFHRSSTTNDRLKMIARHHKLLAKRCETAKVAKTDRSDNKDTKKNSHKKQKKTKHESKHHHNHHKSIHKHHNNSTASNGKDGNVDAKLAATTGRVNSVSGSGSYQRVKQNRGNNFWSDGSWDFWTWDDPTHSQVAYQSESAAKQQGLIGINDGVAFLRASNKDVWSGNRPSVRFQSSKAYQSGLVIFDVVKMPVGCGTWPALWSTYGQNWPNGAEFDVMEGVGYTAGGQNANQMTVHMGQDSPLKLNRRNEKRGAMYSGRLLEGASNCNQWGEHTGCAFFDNNKNGPSWGPDFNSAGGGIWAMQFGNNQGVKIWFWGRKSGSIPDELQDPSQSPDKLDPTSWGTPVANFQSSVINTQTMPQNIIVNIAIGGDWGSNVPTDGKCQGQNFWDAIKKGSNYNDAEFQINAIDVYCLNGKC